MSSLNTKRLPTSFTMTRYTEPLKRIITTEDLAQWTESPTYAKLNQFIERLAESIKGLTNDAAVPLSASTEALMSLFDHLEEILDRYPVVADANTSRFGKVEFRDFYDDVKASAAGLLKPLVEMSRTVAVVTNGAVPTEESPSEALPLPLSVSSPNPNDSNSDPSDSNSNPTVELAAYLVESFGNRTRIDYGSGHELHFMSLLLCLDELHLFTTADSQALVLRVFVRYMTFMRRLQREYWLEPAGSHGVWGLDDYHFLPFLFGAWQLYGHPHLKPRSIRSPDMVEMFNQKYMYFECIQFINEVKNVPLRWHSPMLDDISGAKSWAKVAEGMFKMFRAEVLGKLPVMQHFLFASLLPAPDGMSVRGDGDAACGHDHPPVNTWGDCCGIKVPSAIGASQMQKRALPFD